MQLSVKQKLFIGIAFALCMEFVWHRMAEIIDEEPSCCAESYATGEGVLRPVSVSPAVEQAVSRFHTQFNSKAYDEIYREARTYKTKDQLVEVLRSNRELLGEVITSRPTYVYQDLNNDGSKRFMVDYITKYSSYGDLTEHFVLNIINGEAKLHYYSTDSILSGYTFK